MSQIVEKFLLIIFRFDGDSPFKLIQAVTPESRYNAKVQVKDKNVTWKRLE